MKYLHVKIFLSAPLEGRTFLRDAEARTRQALDEAIAHALPCLTPHDAGA
ncbi:MAG: hypothetical protein JWM80_836 [Cyanobacteria bacterium RYN_339]|nr:hypothetical protein [Cyanobacteria bacterium RYN_339]